MNDQGTPKVYQTQDQIDAVRFGGDVDFRDATFKCHADFSAKKFKGKVDFTDAVFENGTSFEDAIFETEGQDVLFDNAVFLSSGNEVTFKKAQFRTGVNDVSFKGCRFENCGGVYFGSVSFANGGSVDFQSANFANEKGVYFSRARFINDESVYFGRANFTNGEKVCFNSAKFGQRGSVGFDFVIFTNGGEVSFKSTEFANGGYVSFDSAGFGNGGDVWFSSARFTNGGQVWFHSAWFTNPGHVGFDSAKFTNRGALNFGRMIWANSKSLLWWREVEFKETATIKFDECLFLSKGGISFTEIRLPEKGSLMFQRCYFARMQRIDFTGVFFRHTMFEGGPISWFGVEEEKRVKNPDERKLGNLIRERFKEGYDRLPQKAKDRIEKLNIEIPDFTRVFAQGVEVLWKDLTTESAKSLTFRLTNLSGSIFDGMTLSHIQLNAPKWADIEGRRCLYEEKKWRGSDEKIPIDQLINIGDQYTQLKNNLERQGNYLHAGDFHYGEQEIRREILVKEKGWYKHITNIFKYLLATFYKALSGYGERPARSVCVFLGCLLPCGWGCSCHQSLAMLLAPLKK